MAYDLARLDAAIAELVAFRHSFDLAPPPSAVTRVTAGTRLQAVIDAAAPGAVLELEPATYEGPVRLSAPITLQAAVRPTGRAGAAASVWLTSADETLTYAGLQGNVVGIGVKSTNPDMQIVSILPSATQSVLDQCTVLGDPLKGQRRGIRAEGSGMSITRCYIDEIWRVGLETQGIGASDGCRDLLVDDCFIAGASQAVMCGGSDASSAEAMPTNIRLLRSTCTKRAAWYAKKAQIKCALELKAAAHVVVSDCLLEFAGNAEGQGSYLIVLTPRNQYGGAPWSRVEDVTFERVHGRSAGGAVALLGRDDQFPSGPCTDITFRHVLFDHIDPTAIWKGDGRAVFFNNGPRNVTFEHVAIMGAHLGASLYAGGAPPTGLVMRDVQLPAATYGIKIDGGGMGLAAFQAYAPDAVLDLVPSTGPIGYPA